MINHGYKDITEYIADINKAHLSIKNRGYGTEASRTEIERLKLYERSSNNNEVLIAWRTHYVINFSGQYYPRKEVDRTVLSAWFIEGVPYTSKYEYFPGQIHFTDLTPYPTKYTDIKEWGIFNNDALPYIRLSKEYIQKCFQFKLNPLNSIPVLLKKVNKQRYLELAKLEELNAPRAVWILTNLQNFHRKY